jgi:hypothetical protein
MADENRRGLRWLPSSRALVIDILHYARKVPSQPLVRRCNIRPLMAAREKAARKIAWPVIFMRAYGVLGARTAGLRQTYMPWPWPHVYQHDQTACMMAVERQYRGQPRLFFGLYRTPEERSLGQLQQRLEGFKEQPVERVEEYKWQRRLAACPWPLRRVVWWLALNVSGYVRVRHFGTFGITTVGSLGAISIHAPSIQTTMLSFGPVEDDGSVRVTIVYDHRLMDGAMVARWLAELEQVLCGQMVEEVKAAEVESW